MRYIVNANNYITTISFGCYVECQDDGCTEYTGSVPTGYTSLEDWYADEAEKLYRWKIVNGQLTMDSSAVAPEKDYDHLADKNNPHGVTAAQVGAAPSGFGLGTTTKYLGANDDLNAITGCGFYSYVYNGVPANGFVCDNPFQYVYHLAVSIDANGTITQTITTCGAAPNDANYSVRRVKGFSTWSEWEWVNPPMQSNAEYRTTERFYSKPVYKRVLDVGYLGAGVNSFNHGIANIDECVGIEMINEGFGLFTAHCDAEFSQTGIYLNMPWAAGAIRLILSYTKN